MIRLLKSLIEDLKIYRWIKGGKWYYYKFGRDTPCIRLFAFWERFPLSIGNVTLLAAEDYGLPLIGKILVLLRIKEEQPRIKDE